MGMGWTGVCERFGHARGGKREICVYDVEAALEYTQHIGV